MTRSSLPGGITFTLRPEEEDMTPEDCLGFKRTGIDHSKLIAEIHDRLAQDDSWAWCYVVVEAHFAGFIGKAGMGGCSYENEKDFKRGSYYADLCHEAVSDLRRAVRAAADDARRAHNVAVLLSEAT